MDCSEPYTCAFVIQLCRGDSRGDMEEVSRKAKIEHIDSLLRNAEICNAQLKFLDNQLNEPNVDDTRRKNIELACATTFKVMMSNLYSVLDHSYFFLYSSYRSNGDISFDSNQIKQPVTYSLKWSKDATRDNHPECKEGRNSWITKQCKAIFGNNCPKHVRDFQENLLQLQVIREVDKSGEEVRGGKREPKLLRAVKIQHDGPGNDLQFNPSDVSFEELKSVEKMDDWNDTSIFNLLHFFRNFVVHKSLNLIACLTKDAYINCGRGGPCILTEKGSWIVVPELSHLRPEKQSEKQSKLSKHYVHPLDKVCDKALTFVIDQRNRLCFYAGGSTYPYKIGYNLRTGMITFKTNNVPKGECRWEMAPFYYDDEGTG